MLSFENVQSILQVDNKGGKSNSFFYSSNNQKIVIKTISSEERETFLKFLPAYTRRIIEEPESKLVRIFGLFQILPNNQDLIIMENALPNKSDCLIFDLKGSTVDRHVPKVNSEDPPRGIVLKDLNFKRYGKLVNVENKDKVIAGLVADMKLLKDNKLMDYSMLLRIHEGYSPYTRYSVGEGYSIAIIDFFERYGIRKFAERAWKRYALRKKKGVSSISSIKYYRRIKRYLKTIIVGSSEQ